MGLIGWLALATRGAWIRGASVSMISRQGMDVRSTESLCRIVCAFSNIKVPPLYPLPGAPSSFFCGAISLQLIDSKYVIVFTQLQELVLKAQTGLWVHKMGCSNLNRRRPNSHVFQDVLPQFDAPEPDDGNGHCSHRQVHQPQGNRPYSRPRQPPS